MTKHELLLEKIKQRRAACAAIKAERLEKAKAAFEELKARMAEQAADKSTKE